MPEGFFGFTKLFIFYGYDSNTNESLDIIRSGSQNLSIELQSICVLSFLMKARRIDQQVALSLCLRGSCRKENEKKCTE
jgi:hypothetical protein